MAEASAGSEFVGRMIREPRAWSLLFLAEERQFQGNDGYVDSPTEFYSYDSTVSNARHVQPGDIVLLRNSTQAIGAAVVDHVETEEGVTKTRRRCPNAGCRKTSFKERKNEKPRFRCSPCQTTFDDPFEEEIVVTRYRAHYRSSWTPLESALERAVLDQLVLNRSAQQSIRPLAVGPTVDVLARRGIFLPAYEDLPAGVPLLPVQLSGPTTIGGGRSRALVLVRHGQKGFRRALLRKYGFICAVTGPGPGEALEAAHLRAFATTEQHPVDEGVLLRRDVHALFDGGLLAIDAKAKVVRVAPRLTAYPTYAALDGQGLAVPDELLPSPEVLSDHFRAASATW